VRGDLLNSAGDQSGAERHYRQAIVVAERQTARLFQLRASINLARLWREQGKRTEAVICSARSIIGLLKVSMHRT
jgi:hypothetical protein